MTDEVIRVLDFEPEYPIVAVYAFDWAGATSTTENFDKEEIIENIKPINAWIAGMLVEENDEFIVICQTYFNDAKNHRCPIAISKKTILHRIDY